MKQIVAAPDRLTDMEFDRILVTKLDSKASALQKIEQYDIAADLVIEII